MSRLKQFEVPSTGRDLRRELPVCRRCQEALQKFVIHLGAKQSHREDPTDPMTPNSSEHTLQKT